MIQHEYEQNKRECFNGFCKRYRIEEPSEQNIESFDWIFDHAYALGREKETITQEEIEKVAKEYVLTRQQARHNAKREEDATLRDFDKTIKAWDAFDMEQAYEDGANYALGKQEKDADTVIQGWVARDKTGYLVLHYKEPHRTLGGEKWYSAQSQKSLPRESFPDLTWESDPIEVEIIIKRKKK